MNSSICWGVLAKFIGALIITNSVWPGPPGSIRNEKPRFGPRTPSATFGLPPPTEKRATTGTVFVKIEAFDRPRASAAGSKVPVKHWPLAPLGRCFALLMLAFIKSTIGAGSKSCACAAIPPSMVVAAAMIAMLILMVSSRPCGVAYSWREAWQEQMTFLLVV